jgi:hypothetical protein
VEFTVKNKIGNSTEWNGKNHWEWNLTINSRG